MKTAIIPMDFLKNLGQLPFDERRAVVISVTKLCETGEAPGLVDFGDHKRFTIGRTTVHYTEDEASITFATLHRFADY